MTNSLYANSKTDIVCTSGGTLGVDASGTTALSGSSVPCRVLHLSTTSANAIHFAVGSTNVSLGALVPSVGSVEIGVDDAQKVFLHASAAGSVFCSYLR